MALQNAKPGLGSVPEYQVAGVPASGVVNGANAGIGNLGDIVNFTRVTTAVTVWTTDRACAISFDGGETLIPLDRDGRPIRFEIKIKSMQAGSVLLPTFNHRIQFVAELSNITAGNCPIWDPDDWVSIA